MMKLNKGNREHKMKAMKKDKRNLKETVSKITAGGKTLKVIPFDILVVGRLGRPYSSRGYLSKKHQPKVSWALCPNCRYEVSVKADRCSHCGLRFQ